MARYNRQPDEIDGECGAAVIRNGSKERKNRDYCYGLEEGVFPVVLVFWGLQLHLLDLLAIVLFSVKDYRIAWLYPSGSGLSYFQSNAVIAVSLLILALLHTVRAWREGKSARAIVVPVAFVLFVSLFSYRLVFLNSHALSDEWYAEATRDEAYYDLCIYLGLVLDQPGKEVATILLDDGNHTEIELSLPSLGDPSRVVTVVEQRARFSGHVRYKTYYFVPYDDLLLFLSQNTSLEIPR